MQKNFHSWLIVKSLGPKNGGGEKGPKKTILWRTFRRERNSFRKTQPKKSRKKFSKQGQRGGKEKKRDKPSRPKKIVRSDRTPLESSRTKKIFLQAGMFEKKGEGGGAPIKKAGPPPRNKFAFDSADLKDQEKRSRERRGEALLLKGTEGFRKQFNASQEGVKKEEKTGSYLCQGRRGETCPEEKEKFHSSPSRLHVTLRNPKKKDCISSGTAKGISGSAKLAFDSEKLHPYYVWG